MKFFLLTTSFLLVITLGIKAQDIRFNRNFVIAIDDKIKTNGINGVQLILNSTEVVDIGYRPGELYFANEEDRNKVYSDTANNILLRFYYNEFKKGEQFIHTYDISLNKKWFAYSFVVLRIYNTNSKKSLGTKKKSYYYGLDFPGYSILPMKNN